MSSWIAPIILLAGMALSLLTRKLDIIAAITGGVIGFSIFLGAGYTGLAMLACFFLLGTLATSWKMRRKETQGLAESLHGKRTAGQVIANAGVGGAIGLMSWTFPVNSDLFILMIAASFSAATADTLSSELGNVYGSGCYNIVSFKKDKKGLNGVVSIEGTLFGVAGSMLIALVYATGFGWNRNVIWIVFAGTIGNLADSILGATLERKNYLGNNAVNFLSALVAAVCVLLYRLKLFPI